MTDHYTYVIVGAGMTADAAARGIREIDDSGTIALFGTDSDEPYTRPALTKKLWTDEEFTEDDNWLRTTDDTSAEIRTSTEVTEIDPDQHTITVGGRTVGYDSLLLATGGEPNHLDLPAGDRVIHFRTFDDYRRLRELADRDLRIAVVGGSFIGTELAAALVQHNTRVTLIYPDTHLTGSVFPPNLARHFEQTYADRGVSLRAESHVTSGREIEGGRIELTLDTGSVIEVDAVVAGIGIAPSISLAEAAGIDTADGIVVDEHLRTSAQHVYAAGDVASYPDQLLGRRRVEHVDQAKTMGRAAGRIMAGSTETYDYSPLFYSNVFDFSYEAVGDLDASMTLFEDWKDPLVSGAVYYLSEEQVRGVLLWNLPDKVDAARQILAAPGPHAPDTLRGRLTGG